MRHFVKDINATCNALATLLQCNRAVAEKVDAVTKDAVADLIIRLLGQTESCEVQILTRIFLSSCSSAG